MNGQHASSGFLSRRFVQGAGVAGLGSLAGCGRLPGQAQEPQAVQVHRIAYFSNAPSAEPAELMAAFRQRMQELGYVEGQTLRIDERYPTANDQLSDAAAALVRLQPAVILVGGVSLLSPVLAATTAIPVVNPNNGGVLDPVASGLTASYARPDGSSRRATVGLPRDAVA
ncbi:MAG TPA: hypothetical protein VII06_26880 [Chloroflexota bacterium]|jgi:putative ABC transport system substrate-binding protein